MDSKTTIQESKDFVRKFCEARDWDQFHNAKDLAIGITTESAELLEMLRFKSDKEIEDMFKNTEKRERLSDEIADTFYFLLRLAQKYNVDLSTELKKKLEKNEKKYPVVKVKGSNKKYNEL
jgi:NTP pyrophosphatase (non-canonical NTP hydrolase)